MTIDDAKVRELYADPRNTVVYICEQIGIPRGSFGAVSRRLGLPSRRRGDDFKAYIPSEAEIKAGCEAARAQWSEEVHRSRAGLPEEREEVFTRAFTMNRDMAFSEIPLDV